MRILSDIFVYFFTTVYLLLYGNENIVTEKSTKLNIDLVLNDNPFSCTSEETKFKISFSKLVITSKTVRLYHVQMTDKKTGTTTEGWYPMFGPRCLKDTGYPHHLAIRSHYQLHYKK